MFQEVPCPRSDVPKVGPEALPTSVLEGNVEDRVEEVDPSKKQSGTTLPYPMKKPKEIVEGKFKRFLKLLQGLNITIPFTDALSEMPSYAKFLREILSKKRSIIEMQDEVKILELPQKLGDPGRFAITIGIGSQQFKALCDLGASINLMPLSVFKQLRVGECRPTTVTLQLADRSHAYPEGKIEDVLVKVDKFIFPVDFIVLEFEADKEVPIILGRHFLPTGKTLIDVQK